MFRFFRQLRQRLITENKFSKYLLYAIGEIVLLIIGILIALQVNELKNNRDVKKLEAEIINGLHEDFGRNTEEIRKAKEINERAITSAITTIRLIGPDGSKIIGYDTDSLILSALNVTHFTTSENALNDLIGSGRLHLIKNKRLKNDLYNWSRQVRSVQLKYNGWQESIDNKIIPYLMTRYPFRDISTHDLSSAEYNYGHSELEVDKALIFKDLEFENLLDDFIFSVKRYQDELRSLEQTAESIVNETKGG